MYEGGAAAYIDFTASEDLVADVKEVTNDGLGPKASLLLVVSAKPLQQATKYVRSRGAVVCIGMPDNADIETPISDAVIRMISIKGSYVGNRADTAEALEFFRKGLIRVPYKSSGLSELEEVYTLMKENKILGRYVVDTSK